MREIFEAELKQVGDDLAEMSRLVESAISRAGTALLTADLQLAQSVIASDHAIDALERELDERCVLLLAQQQPVATDLRVVVSALRMSATLERMGDLARHVAQVARGRYPAHAIHPLLEVCSEQRRPRPTDGRLDQATHLGKVVTDLLELGLEDFPHRIPFMVTSNPHHVRPGERGGERSGERQDAAR